MEAAREARESLEEADRDAAAMAQGKITAAKDMTQNMHTFKYDKKMTSCEGCSKKFTTFLRRHHCRGCRGAYCHYCSKKTNSRVCPFWRSPLRQRWTPNPYLLWAVSWSRGTQKGPEFVVVGTRT